MSTMFLNCNHFVILWCNCAKNHFISIKYEMLHLIISLSKCFLWLFFTYKIIYFLFLHCYSKIKGTEKRPHVVLKDNKSLSRYKSCFTGKNVNQEFWVIFLNLVSICYLMLLRLVRKLFHSQELKILYLPSYLVIFYLSFEKGCLNNTSTIFLQN